MRNAINLLDKIISKFRKEQPQMGLPEEIFHFVSRSTPIVNVDLLIKDEDNRVLLAWRDDEFAGSGWHVPGGIVRFKETIVDRLKLVSELEIGSPIEYQDVPLCVEEVILEHDTRGHFVSFLYACKVPNDFVLNNNNSFYGNFNFMNEGEVGHLQWHDNCPDNLVPVQTMYISHIKDKQWN